MEGFLDAPFPAFRSRAPVHFPSVDISIPPQDGRLRALGEPVQEVFGPVLQNPDDYLMSRYAPFEEVPEHWEKFSGNNYIGLQQHTEEEWDEAEHEQDMDDGEETKGCTKTSPQDAMSPASQPVAKRDDSMTDDSRLLGIIASPSSVPAFGLQDASQAAFGSILEPVPNPEVQNLNIDQANGLGD